MKSQFEYILTIYIGNELGLLIQYPTVFQLFHHFPDLM